MTTPSRAIFLDRDGVLLKDINLITNANQVEMFPKVGDAISILKNLGFKIFLISNQTVVSRGLLTFEEMVTFNNQILGNVKAQNPLAIFDGVYLCPHHPKATLEKYRIDCECRKPKAGMILEAQKKFNLNLAESYVIGDRPTDIYSGKSVGCVGIQLVNNTNDKDPLIETTLNLKPEWLKPDYTFDSLHNAALFIKERV